MSEKLNIEQLVSSTLAEAEMIPSQGAWKGIQRKLRWRQFMRFNPAQLNVYYLAGLLLAATGLVLVLSSRNIDPLPIEPVENSLESNNEAVGSEEGSNTPFEEGRDSREEKEIAGLKESAPEGKAETTADDAANQKKDASLNDARSEETSKNKTEEESILPAAIPMDPVENPVIENQTLPALACYFISSTQSGCAPLEVQFYNKSTNSSLFAWSFGSESQSSVSDPLHTFEEPGKYTVTLRIEDKNGQSALHQQDIEVYPMPTADFDIEEGFEGIDGHVALNLLNYSTGANAYSWNLLEEDYSVIGHWSSEEFQPALGLTHIKNGAKSIRLVAISENECMDTAISVLPVMVESSDVKIKFATAFSPNPTGPGDGTFSPHEKRIDLFHPIFLEVPVEYYLRVYTKRGELVFETRDAYQGWDGYFHEERSAGGVYIWMLEGTWLNGETFKMQGDVTLIWQDIW